MPGRGAGESNWFYRGLRNLEQNVDKTSRELDIRTELRNWDEHYPWIHHELIIRYVAGGLASTMAMFLYNSLLRSGKSRSRRR